MAQLRSLPPASGHLRPPNPVTLRDADLIVEAHEDAPDGVAMILRTDRRLGFDPAAPWTMSIKAVREHGMFQPEIGSVSVDVTIERLISVCATSTSSESFTTDTTVSMSVS